MSSNHAEVLEQVSAFAHECCANHDPAHDIAHVRRVVVNAERIVTCEPEADAFTTLAAAWLHDIVQMPKGTGRPGESAHRSAEHAAAFLHSIGVSQISIACIKHAIEAHSFSGGLKPETIEAAIVQDADRLDAIGAIGIARLWVTAGVMGSKLHHATDPAGHRRELDDRTFGLDHIPVKLLKLPDLMNTSAGKQLAIERAKYVDEFRTRFLDELGGTR